MYTAKFTIFNKTVNCIMFLCWSIQGVHNLLYLFKLLYFVILEVLVIIPTNFRRTYLVKTFLSLLAATFILKVWCTASGHSSRTMKCSFRETFITAEAVVDGYLDIHNIDWNRNTKKHSSQRPLTNTYSSVNSHRISFNNILDFFYDLDNQ